MILTKIKIRNVSHIPLYQIRLLSQSSILFQYQLPSDYKPQKKQIKSISLKRGWRIWKQSLKADRLQQLQDELVDLMINKNDPLNANIKRENAVVKLNNEGQDHINEINFEIINHESYPMKHIVFIHGYGASLGCFARNFQLINKFQNKSKYNYKVHFLDNITFGLSSNPQIKSTKVKGINNWIIPKCPDIKVKQGEDEKLYHKYYKLVEQYKINGPEFENYQTTFKPILSELEDFYTSAIDNWRISQGIDQIDYLVGHSFGGYWSGSYSLRYPTKLKNLILLSPVGVERHVHAVTNDLIDSNQPEQTFKPTINPVSYNFLTRLPILSAKHTFEWYYKTPFLPRVLKYLGPIGVQIYFQMWLSKLFKINKIINKFGGPEKLFSNNNDLVYGRKKECFLIIEYLYNSITRGSNSDIYIKNLLTPATVSKYPLYDKFENFLIKDGKQFDFNVSIVYGQYDFMNSEAGQKLVEMIRYENGEKSDVKFFKIAEGGHNLYIDNPFDTNQLIHDIVEGETEIHERVSEVYRR
ncbi:Alpha/Beta hydrolase protein [Scheffersomyces coipomensis]|uniref:Alpha/Beta hydrolase protein n=1 Tax=Scheffersomyces coipomensis TaxID=1788519 RepID=UPI00315D2956